MWLAQGLVWLIGTYASIGWLFAFWFVTRGLGRVDTTAQTASWGLRILLLPGTAAFWPWLAWRCARNHGEPSVELNAQRSKTT